MVAAEKAPRSTKAIHRERRARAGPALTQLAGMRPMAACKATAATAAAHPQRGTGDPVGRMAGEEEGRERNDEPESGDYETEPTEDRAGPSPQTPGAEDGQLGRRRTGQEVGRCDGILELDRPEPALPLDAELTQHADVGGRSAEPGATDAPPLPHDGAVGNRWGLGLVVVTHR